MPKPARPRHASSQTGEIPRVEEEGPHDHREQAEPRPPATLPEMPPLSGSTTGIIPIVSEDADPAATGDDDTPDGP